MLGFIAKIEPERLIEAKERSGEITAAKLYELLVRQWLDFEYARANPPGAPRGLSREALRAHYLQEIRPYLTDSPAAYQRKLFATAQRVSAYFGHLNIIMPVASHGILRDLEEICEERRQLLAQRRMHFWLHGWLLVHVPLSFALLLLTAVHAVVSLRY